MGWRKDGVEEGWGRGRVGRMKSGEDEGWGEEEEAGMDGVNQVGERVKL